MQGEPQPNLKPLLEKALAARLPALAEPHHQAVRLFNGFYEGYPDLVVDLYASTLVLFHYGTIPGAISSLLPELMAFYRHRLPWLSCILLKNRHAQDPNERNGTILWGGPPSKRIREENVWYALNLTMHQDASFYLDTRTLRGWLKEHTAGLTVLNTFAYTGSLGAACQAGGAERVVQVDLNRQFLNLAKDTWSLNGWLIRRSDFLCTDVFRQAGIWRRHRECFDLVILDPPFFAQTEAGRVDLVQDSARLINKLRPLVKDGGRLVAVNNALFVSGAAYLQTLDALSAEGYVTLEEILPVPADVTGFPETLVAPPPTDPAPFNHPTKIAILRIRHRQKAPKHDLSPTQQG